MRIDRLELENFKKYARQTIDLHPQFTLLIGDNGAGKTTMLEALAVAAGIWLTDVPDTSLISSRREIDRSEIRLEPETVGDRTQFRECLPVRVAATGLIGDQSRPVTWTRQIRSSGKRTTNAEAKQALDLIRDVYARDASGENLLCPVLAYYGAGRAWLASRERTGPAKRNGAARRWAAFYDCFNERIRFGDLHDWFVGEFIERGNRAGRWRPGFDVVRRAVLRCVPDADDLRYDSDRKQIVLSIAGQPLPIDNLSAGQRMMLALVADLAIKAVTQNAFLVPRDQLPPDVLPEVLAKTPGLVLIDELDVHLHPNWQRRVARDLKETFPAIQFICTTHSPQVIGELPAEEIRVLKGDRILVAGASFGIDSSRILEEVMGAESRTNEVGELIHKIHQHIDAEELDAARALLPALESLIGSKDAEMVRARGLIDLLTAV